MKYYSNSSVLAMGLLQSCTKSSIYHVQLVALTYMWLNKLFYVLLNCDTFECFSYIICLFSASYSTKCFQQLGEGWGCKNILHHIFGRCYHAIWNTWFYKRLTHWGRDRIYTISQTTFSNAFSRTKMNEFLLGFHWSLFPRFESTIFQQWFR